MSNSGVTSEADETRSTAYITGIYMNQTSNCEQGKANDADPADQESGDKAADLFEYNVVKAPPKICKLKNVPQKASLRMKIKKTKVNEELGRRQKRDNSSPSSPSASRTFPCDYCDEVFLRMQLRQTHTKEKHPDYFGKFICIQCQSQFKSRQQLYQHRMRAHEPLGEFWCSFCDSKFAKESGLKRHVQIHSENPKWVCSFCSKSSFLSRGDMDRHIRNKHTGKKPYTCHFDGCDKSYSSSGDRAKHHLHHTGERRFQCTVCGLKMFTSGELKQHSWTHTGERPFVCTTCGEAFRQPFRLKMHTRIHTGEKPFQCETCGKAFSDKVYLKRHEAVHGAERAFICPTCGKTFKHDSNLRRHVSTTHNKKFPHVCSECGEGCQGKEEFERHKAKHRGVRAFHCPSCNKAFFTPHDVDQHVKIVHNVVRSTCSLCDATFKDLRTHKTHFLRIHNASREGVEKEICEAKKLKKKRMQEAWSQDSAEKRGLVDVPISECPRTTPATSTAAPEDADVFLVTPSLTSLVPCAELEDAATDLTFSSCPRWQL